MFDSLVNFVIEHAAAATVTLVVTGVVTFAAEVDSRTKDAKADSPAWLRFLSAVLSKLARNVKHAKNASAALLALVLIPTLLLVGCASVHKGGVRAGGMAEAYRLEGPEVRPTTEGELICTTEDAEAAPCVYEYAGGWELWDPIVQTLAVPFEAALQLFGRTLAPTP